ncbi:MAG: hypothetical protein KDC61_10400, partial [Saprospiraceae bacterium]|nr:hypothetical protein [Saprospiraceae bacterium]
PVKGFLFFRCMTKETPMGLKTGNGHFSINRHSLTGIIYTLPGHNMWIVFNYFIAAQIADQ